MLLAASSAAAQESLSSATVPVPIPGVPDLVWFDATHVTHADGAVGSGFSRWRVRVRTLDADGRRALRFDIR